jgi:hypothetical protein
MVINILIEIEVSFSMTHNEPIFTQPGNSCCVRPVLNLPRAEMLNLATVTRDNGLPGTKAEQSTNARN